ncbi:hypothetical protein HKX48_003471 [Thoreauomyces humboldtii]|nr:hypothetical protein HKX48_003471 [Thoreauomyces humboldtii]
MALNSIQARLDVGGKYKSVEQVMADLELVFDNAMAYNLEKSRIWKDANLLKQRLNKEMRAIQAEIRADSQSQDPEDNENDGAEVSASIPPKTAGKTTKAPALATANVSTGRKPIKIDKEAAQRKDLLDKILGAIEASDIAALEPLLESVTDINALIETNLFGADFTWTPLHAAAYFGNKDIVELLITKGADVEASDTWYHSKPLGWAAYSGNLEMCEMLIQKYHADLSFVNLGGQTAKDMIAEPDDPRWGEIFAEGIESKAPAKTGGKRKKTGDDGGESDGAGIATRRSGRRGSSGAPVSAPSVKLVLHPEADSQKVKIRIPPSSTSAVAPDRPGPMQDTPGAGKRLPRHAKPSTLGTADAFIDIEDISGDDSEAKGDAMDGVDVGARSGRNSGAMGGKPGATSSSSIPRPPRAVPPPAGPATTVQASPPSLVISLGLVSNDDHIRLILPLATCTTHHSLTIPHRVKSLNLRLLLLASPLTYTVRGQQQSVVATAPGPRRKDLPFKTAGKTVWDCLVTVDEGVNVFDFLVVGSLPGSLPPAGDPVMGQQQQQQQAKGVMEQTVTLYMNRV